MFPYQPNNYDHIQDFGAPNPSVNPRANKFILEYDPIENRGNDLIPTTSNRRERLIPFGIQDDKEKIKKDEVVNVRKYVRKENERQRRQEMGNLCGSLLTLLPHQYVNGKRSMSDHMQGAVNYIKDMENNINQLKSHRDKLKKSMPNSDGSSQIDGDNNNNNLHNCVTVNPYPNGVEILISTIFEDEQGISLSRILTELLERGFNVVSCFSSKPDERFLHTIQLEASNLTLEDLSVLQERLTYMINFPG